MPSPFNVARQFRRGFAARRSRDGAAPIEQKAGRRGSRVGKSECVPAELTSLILSALRVEIRRDPAPPGTRAARACGTGRDHTCIPRVYIGRKRVTLTLWRVRSSAPGFSITRGWPSRARAPANPKSVPETARYANKSKTFRQTKAPLR